MNGNTSSQQYPADGHLNRVRDPAFNQALPHSTLSHDGHSQQQHQQQQYQQYGHDQHQHQHQPLHQSSSTNNTNLDLMRDFSFGPSLPFPEPPIQHYSVQHRSSLPGYSSANSNPISAYPPGHAQNGYHEYPSQSAAPSSSSSTTIPISIPSSNPLGNANPSFAQNGYSTSIPSNLPNYIHSSMLSYHQPEASTSYQPQPPYPHQNHLQQAPSIPSNSFVQRSTSIEDSSLRRRDLWPQPSTSASPNLNNLEDSHSVSSAQSSSNLLHNNDFSTSSLVDEQPKSKRSRKSKEGPDSSVVKTEDVEKDPPTRKQFSSCQRCRKSKVRCIRKPGQDKVSGRG